MLVRESEGSEQTLCDVLAAVTRLEDLVEETPGQWGFWLLIPEIVEAEPLSLKIS